MRSWACAVAWSSAIVSMVSDGKPLCMADPPMARLIALFNLLLTALIFHPVLLWVLARQAPSDWMKRLVHWLRNSLVLCLLCE